MDENVVNQMRVKPEAPTSGAKRAASNRDACPTTVDEVVEWLSSAIPEGFERKNEVLDNARQRQIDGAALLQQGEADLKELGVSKFGVCRKLRMRIDDLRAVLASQAAQSDVANAAAAAEAPSIERSEGGARPVEERASVDAPRTASASHTEGSSERDAQHVEDRMNAEGATVGACQWVANKFVSELARHNGQCPRTVLSASCTLKWMPGIF